MGPLLKGAISYSNLARRVLSGQECGGGRMVSGEPMTIRIKNSTYRDILMGQTANGLADMILPILRAMRGQGWQVLVVDDFTGVVIEKL